MKINKIKAAFVVNSLKSRNGADVFLVDLVTAFAMNGKINFILVCLYDEIDESFIKILKEHNVKVYFCHKKRKIDLKCSREFKKIINNFSPNIINTHLSVLPTYFLAFGFLKRQWRIVKTYHSVPGHDLKKINVVLEKIYLKKKMLFFIGISDEISKKSLLMFPKATIRTIENGIFLPQQNELHEAKREYDFIIVASLEPIKNHYLLLNAFRKFLQKYPFSKLVIVGGGSKEREYKVFVSNNSMENNVVFTGPVDDVFEYLNKSKIFVLSSLQEGNPISILEAVSVGLPIIAPRVGGIPNVIKNEINGLLFNLNDEIGLLNAMTILYENDVLKRTISINNKIYAKDFSIEKTANEYFDYFCWVSKTAAN